MPVASPPAPPGPSYWEALGSALLPGPYGAPDLSAPVFHTVLFVGLFTLIYALYVAFGRFQQARVGIALGFSLYFYYRLGGWVAVPFTGHENPVLLPIVGLMLLVGVVDFYIARAMHNNPDEALRKTLLYLSLGLSLGLLGFFKYHLFWGSLFGAGDSVIVKSIEVIGLSYFTFKSISYVLDVYQETLPEPEDKLAHYLLYLSFFPAILAGPIHRAEQFLPQLRQPFVLSGPEVGRAFWLFLTGLFKKTVIADYLGANYVDRIFESPELFTGLENLLASFAFGIQLFFDFSGYTNMALALALLLGFRIAGNFNEPFKARNISEFWRRWHITLSEWFNDYVYTPLAFRWRALKRWGAVLAVLVTFLLSGFWHGPNWTFILWGAAHGVAIAWETATRKPRARWRTQLNTQLYDGASWLLTFLYLGVTYMLFKAANLAKVGEMFGQIGTNFRADLFGDWFIEYGRVAVVLGLGLLLIFLPTHLKTRAFRWYETRPWYTQVGLAVLAVVATVQGQTAESQPFIYLGFG